MRKNIFDEHSVSESGNWNMAQSFMEDLYFKVKVFDENRAIARFGYMNLVDHLNQGVEFDLNYDKLEALKQMAINLMDLINDSDALIKKDADSLEILRKKVILIRKMINKKEENNIFKKANDSVNHTTKIVLLGGFDLFLEELCEIKRNLLKIFYKNDLIFPTKTQFDPKSWKDSIKGRIIEQG